MREKERSESMREEDTTAAIHGGFTQQMRGDQISHRGPQRESQVPKGDGNKEEGADDP